MTNKSRRSPPQSKELIPEDLQKALEKLDRRIAELEEFDVSSISERFDAKAVALKDKINDSLVDIFAIDTVEYNRYRIGSLDTLPIVMGGRKDPLPKVQEAYRKGIDNAITKLKSLRETLQEKLEDAKSDSPIPSKPTPSRRYPGNREVFIVHGHDEEAKVTVARFLSQLELKPIILHDQPNQGRTIIEKLLDESIVDFAVILLTPDDEGYPSTYPEQTNPRARQNVIFELGLFIGVLGRERVCALYKGNVEIPSDFHGVVYIPMDDGGGWKIMLAREIKAAGIEIDMNKVI